MNEPLFPSTSASQTPNRAFRTTVIMLADHNSLVVKGRDAYRPPEFEQPSALAARDLEIQVLSQQNLRDVWSEVHYPSSIEGFSTEHELNASRGFTFGFPPEGKPLVPERLRHIDGMHASSDLGAFLLHSQQGQKSLVHPVAFFPHLMEFRGLRRSTP